MQSLTGREQSPPAFGLLVRHSNREVHKAAVPVRGHAAVARALQEMAGLGNRKSCERLASRRLHRHTDDGRIALSQSGGNAEEGRTCAYTGNPCIYPSAGLFPNLRAGRLLVRPYAFQGVELVDVEAPSLCREP